MPGLRAWCCCCGWGRRGWGRGRGGGSSSRWRRSAPGSAASPRWRPNAAPTTPAAAAIALALVLLALPLLAPYLLRGPLAADSRRLGLLATLSAGCGYAWTAIASKLLTDQLAAGTVAVAALWLATAAGSESLALLSEMSAVQRRPAIHVAPTMFTVQVLVPVLLAPLIFDESWSQTPLGGAALVAFIARRRRGNGPSGRLQGRCGGDGVRRVTDPVSLLDLPPIWRFEARDTSHTTKEPPSSASASPWLRPARPGASARAVGRGPRRRALVGGRQLTAFEDAWAAWNGRPASASVGRRRPRRAGVRRRRRRDRVLPVQHLQATPLAAMKAGARVECVDCNRDDLCMSFEDFERKAGVTARARRCWSTSAAISPSRPSDRALLPRDGIFLVEDCAHAHGAAWNGRRPGAFGDAGVYSLYATKTISAGEGGMLVSRRRIWSPSPLISATTVSRARGRRPRTSGMSEFTAALGLVQIEWMEEIVGWKQELARTHLDPLFPSPLELPDGMTSGFYKYIVFEELARSTGMVYDDPCHRIMGDRMSCPTPLGGGEPFIRAALLPPRGPARLASRLKVVHEGYGHWRVGLHRLCLWRRG